MTFSRKMTPNPPSGCTARKPISLCPSSLNNVVEEAEPHSSSLDVPSPVLDIKTRRRHATVSVSDIDRLSRVLPADDFLVVDDEEEEEDDRPLSSSPPTSSASDCFSLNFTEKSFLSSVPTPTYLQLYLRRTGLDSPAHSSYSFSSGSLTEGWTPPTSDDEFSSSIMPRYTTKPLLVTKHNQRHFSGVDDNSMSSPPLFRPFKTPLQIFTQPSTLVSPLSPSYLPDMGEYDSDETSDLEYESDSEWYSREFSKIISLPSPLTPSLPFAPHSLPARRDATSMPSPEKAHRSRRRVSKPLPPIPSCGGVPSGQFDPVFPRRRRRSLPKHSPPPIPIIRIEPNPPTPSSSSPSRRPPPRSSIPADCVYDVVVDGSSSSIYGMYLGDKLGRPDTPSSYSQPSFRDPIDEVTFDLEYPIILPPNTPSDLDITRRLEELRKMPVEVQAPVWSAVATDAIVIPEIREPEQQARPVRPKVVVEPPQQQQAQQTLDDGWSFTPTSIAPGPSYLSPIEGRLKSRWSASTLDSIREDHERRGSTGNWRLYFAGHSGLKRKLSGSKKITRSPSFIPSFSGLAPPKHKSTSSWTSPSPSRSPSPSPSRSPSPNPSTTPFTRSRIVKPTQGHTRSQSDVVMIGNRNGGVRGRRGSLTSSVSDAGSEDSIFSDELRRKPIPVEMFLRGAF